MRSRPVVVTQADLAPGRQERALIHLRWLCLATPVLAVVAAVVWVTPATPLEDWLAETLHLVPGAVALLLIWRLVQAGQRDELSQFPQYLRRAGWVLLLGTLLSGLSGFLIQQDVRWADAGLSTAVIFVVGLGLSALPGLGLLVLARVMATVFQLRQDEELTV